MISVASIMLQSFTQYGTIDDDTTTAPFRLTLVQTSDTLSVSHANLRFDQEATQRLRRLLAQRDELQQKLKEEQERHDVDAEYATPDKHEQFLIRQDSLCLDLKSRILDTALQINEIRKK